MNWLNHPAIKKSWIAEKLFGEKGNTQTSLFAQKEKGPQKRFNLTELLRIEEIRQQVIEQLARPDQQAQLVLDAYPPPSGSNTKACFGHIQTDSREYAQKLAALEGYEIFDCQAAGYGFVIRI